jgi:DNA end-binding protein Ku
MINPETGNRIKMVTQVSETGQELQRRDLVQGYEFKKDHYLLLTDEDFDSVKVETSVVMTIEKFVDTDSIDPVYYDAAYFVGPDGDAELNVYAVLSEAVAKTGKIALALRMGAVGGAEPGRGTGHAARGAPRPVPLGG